MSSHQRDFAAEEEERHTDQLPTDADRAAFVERITKALEDGARALLDTAKALREDPEGMLRQAFSPNIIGMHPKALAVIELTHLGDLMMPGKPSIAVRGTTIIDGSRFNEIGFRAMWRDSAIIPMSDDRLG